MVNSINSRRGNAKTNSHRDKETVRSLETVQREEAQRFRVGQPVWPIETKSGKQVLGRQGKVFSVELRIKVKFPGTPQPVDYHPRSLSRKGP